MVMVSPDDLEPKLEALGEEEARKQLGQGVFGPRGAPKRTVVEAWLNKKERKRIEEQQARDNSYKREGLKIKRLAMYAVWVAAGVALLGLIGKWLGWW
ncbi:MAG: hypothetical protein ACE5JQ_15590 [Candidatus Methylomirabilales bacterium]